MIVALVAHTETTDAFWDGFQITKMGEREAWTSDSAYSHSTDLLAEVAGRICYNSFNLPNEKTATNEGYLANIKKQMHFSVLEHASFTFRIEQVSRCLLAELTRHRHHSPSVRSQRYCDEHESGWVVPEALARNAHSPKGRSILNDYNLLHLRARAVYEEIQEFLEELGEKRKVANDAARYALPEGTWTELYVTGNGRAWLEFLVKRESGGAAEEIRQLAGLIHTELSKTAPNTFKES